MTGPEAVSWAEVAEKLSGMLGRSVCYADVSAGEARRRMIAGGRPDWYTDALIVLFLKWAQGGYDLVSDAVERVTGRPPPAWSASWPITRGRCGRLEGSRRVAAHSH